MEIFDLWKGIGNDAEILQAAYAGDNYIVINTGSTNGRCLICFSGNGLYYPNDYPTFAKFVKCDRYEWKNVVKSKEIQDYYEKIILCRDIYKQWYVTGINKNLDTVDKVVDKFNDLLGTTKKWDITTVGNSAGGYASVLFGILLNAQRIFCFSGQFNIYDEIYRDGKVVAPFLEKYRNNFQSKYFDINSLLVKSKVPIYYFYPAYCKWDAKEYSLIKDYKHLYPYPINSKNHGETIWGGEYSIVLTLDESQLRAICNNRIISAFRFARHFHPIMYCLKYYCKKRFKRFKGIYEKYKFIRRHSS